MLQRRVAQVERTQIVVFARRQRRVLGKQGEAVGFVWRGPGVRAVFRGKADRGDAVAPAEQHEVTGLRMFAQAHQVFAERVEKRMLRAQQRGTVLRQTEFAGLGAGAQHARPRHTEHERNQVRARQFAGDDIARIVGEALRQIDVAHGPEGGDERVRLLRFLAIDAEHREQTLDFPAAQETNPLGLDPPRTLRANVQLVERRCHRFLQAVALDRLVGPDGGLPVIGIDPDLVVPPGGMVGGAPQAGNGVVDPLQRPVGEQRARAASVRLFVITEEVDMNDGQPAADVDLAADHAQLAQQDGNGDPGRDEFQFLEEVVSADEAAHEVVQRQPQLQQQQDGDAHKAVEVAEQKRQQHQRVGRAQRRPPAHRRRTEMRFRRAAGVVVRIGAAAREQRLVAAAGEHRLDPRRHLRLVHAHDPARFVVAEGERRDGSFDAIEEFALDRGRRRRQARIVGMQLIVLAPEQPPQEGQFAVFQGALELRLRESVDLDHDQAGPRRRSFRHRQAQQARQPDAAAEVAAQAPVKSLDSAKHGLPAHSRGPWRRAAGEPTPSRARCISLPFRKRGRRRAPHRLRRPRFSGYSTPF